MSGASCRAPSARFERPGPAGPVAVVVRAGMLRIRAGERGGPIGTVTAVLHRVGGVAVLLRCRTASGCWRFRIRASTCAVGATVRRRRRFPRRSTSSTNHWTGVEMFDHYLRRMKDRWLTPARARCWVHASRPRPSPPSRSPPALAVPPRFSAA